MKRLTDNAIADFMSALRIKPHFSEAHYNLGSIFYYQDRHEDALREFELALSIDPVYSRAYLNKALACEKLSRFQEAKSAYEGFIRSADGESDELIDFVSRRIQNIR